MNHPGTTLIADSPEDIVLTYELTQRIAELYEQLKRPLTAEEVQRLSNLCK